MLFYLQKSQSLKWPIFDVLNSSLHVNADSTSVCHVAKDIVTEYIYLICH